LASKESRGLLAASLALAAFAAMLIWVMAGPSGSDRGADEAPEQQAQEPQEPPAAAAAAPPQKPAPQAKPATAKPAAAEPGEQAHEDLFAGNMPDFMAKAHLRVLDDKKLDVGMQKQLYQFGQEHKDDARPQLLLAWDSMNRDWDGIAVRMYRIAYRADPRAKDDPSMLRDLLSVARRYDKVEYRETSDIVEEAYGAEAIPRIDQEIAQLQAQGDQAGITRLQKLRDRLAGQSQ